MTFQYDNRTNQLQIVDSGANASATFQAKGTGAINFAPGSSGLNLSNGGTVTAITRTATGNGSYTSKPTVTISAPTTAGGVQATATIDTMGVLVGTVQSGGTGYTVGDSLSVVGGTGGPQIFTVASVSGGVVTGVTNVSFASYSVLPTNPVATTGGTGTGCTLNLGYNVNNAFTITNAGSGYVEQPTVTFSGGGGSGAAAYASVGTSSTIKQLGGSLGFSGSSGEVFRIYDFGGQAGVGVRGHTLSGGIPSAIFPTPSNGSQTNISFEVASLGTGAIQLSTGGGISVGAFNQIRQLNVAHTASAVNYVQVTGAATGGRPTISSQGSDTNVGLVFSAKGAQNHVFQTNSGNLQFVIANRASSANWAQVQGAIAGAAPAFMVDGSDTNIGLNLTTKGTGTVSLQTGNGTVLQAIDRGGTQDSPFIFRAGLAGTQGGLLTLPVATSMTVPDASRISFATNAGVEQFRVSNTSSAVNYVQVTGAATGGNVTISAQGSDASVYGTLLAKGSGGWDITGNGASTFRNSAGANQFRVTPTSSAVNLIQATGAVAGAAPSFASIGSDTNIDLALTPKGTGLVRFGTYTTLGSETLAGYIEIKDSAGNIRKLAVVA